MSNIQKATLTVSGAQESIFLYTTEGALNDAQKAANAQLGVCPEWDVNTLFSIDYSTYLAGGNIDGNPQTIESWTVYRQKGDTPSLENPITFDGSARGFTDYSAVNNTDYTYYIYPSFEGSLGSPMVTDKIRTDFPCWTLYLVDETDTEGTFKLQKAYDFMLNFETPTITNNTGANVVTTFSRYQRVRKNTVNCLSGSLASLMGYYDPSTIDPDDPMSNGYVETADRLNEMFALSANVTNRKFLRDLQGRLMEVELTGAITAQQQNYNGQIVSSGQVNWMEIADASNVIILK